MPTSLCSGQIARRIADRLNERDAGGTKLSRFVALPHTEGCGVSAGSAETIYSRTVLGHLANPIVRIGLLLEHGCEKTHNDFFRNRLEEAGLDPERFGWASVQLDGGIDEVVMKVEDWFAETLEGRPLQAHLMIPLVQASSDTQTLERHADDLDALLEGDPSLWADQMLRTVAAVASRKYTPSLFAQGNTDFQFTRGLLSISM